MGMFVTGSIMSPRIFISTSMGTSPDAGQCSVGRRRYAGSKTVQRFPLIQAPYQLDQITCSPTRQFGLALVTRTRTYSPRRSFCDEVKFKIQLLELRPDHWPGRRDAPSTSASNVCPTSA